MENTGIAENKEKKSWLRPLIILIITVLTTVVPWLWRKFTGKRDEKEKTHYSVHCLWHGKILYIGKKGGCYYLSKNGNEIYVESYHCSCDSVLERKVLESKKKAIYLPLDDK